MTTNARFAEVAALTGDPARAGMLQALMDGRALTASELARVAGIAPQTASGHLTRMTAAGLLSVQQQGRHRYHRLATPAVARMMESIMQVASTPMPAPKKLTTGPRDVALREARTCYDHLAGKLGVALADALVRKGYAELDQRRRHHHQGRRRFLRPDRARSGRRADTAIQEAGPHALPALSRLERAPAPYRGRNRHRALHALLRHRLDQARGRHARRDHHPEGPAGVPGEIRRRASLSAQAVIAHVFGRSSRSLGGGFQPCSCS